MSKQIVWVIEDGEYSDYRVVGVFSSRENAELVLEKLGSGEIAEWDLDPAVEQINAALKRYYVQMLRDGTVLKANEEQFRTDEHDFLNTNDRYHSDIRGLRVWLFAKDEQHAIKIANDKRITAIANGSWPLASVEAKP